MDPTMTKTSTVSDFMPDTQVQELRPGVTIEAPGAADQEATTRLLNEVLRTDAKVDIEADLPLLVGPDATSYRRIVRTEGKIVAHAALYVHSYRLLNHAFNVGVIGAVATAESERGKGYGSALIDELLWLVGQYNIPVCIL